MAAWPAGAEFLPAGADASDPGAVPALLRGWTGRLREADRMQHTLAGVAAALGQRLAPGAAASAGSYSGIVVQARAAPRATPFACKQLFACS